MREHNFFITEDGVRIVYTEIGDGPPLLYVRGWLSHLDLLWDRPSFRSFIEALSTHYRVIQYDMRGNGLSDREGLRISLDILVQELEDLANHLSLDQFVLWGASFGGPTTMQFAAQHPERVKQLILDGTYAQGKKIVKPIQRWLLILALRFFPEMAFLLLSNATKPNTNRSAQNTLDIAVQMVTPRTGARLYKLAFSTDVRKILKSISARTLVLHALHSRSISVHLGQELVGRIPNAEFFGLDSDQQNSWEGDRHELLAAVGDFLAVDLEPPSNHVPAGTESVSIKSDEPFIFISYSHDNEEEVRESVDTLREQRFNFWMDSGITPGSSWREEVALAVQNCEAFVFFASRSSIKSHHCMHEINFALDENKQILVVYLDNIQLPLSLRMSLNNRQAITKSKYDKEIFNVKLRLGIEKILSKEVFGDRLDQ